MIKKKLNISAIIYCRSNSKRLKNKPFIQIKKLSLLERVIMTTKKIKGIQKIIVATTVNKNDDGIIKIAKKKNIFTFRGSENNVLDRTIKCINKFDIDYFVRICADRVFFDHKEISKYLLKYKKDIKKHDILTNLYNNGKKIDPGLTIEIVSCKSLKDIYHNRKEKIISKEHITKSFYNNYRKFRILYLKSPDYFYKGFKYTIDNLEDLKRSRYVCKKINIKNNIREIIKETSTWYEKKLF